MSIDQVVSAVVYLASAFCLFAVGKWVYDKLHPRFVLREELLERDNFALAIAVAGYYFGLVFAIGGVLVGPSAGIWEDLIDIFLYGLAAIVLLNLSAIVNDKIILYRFDNVKEIIDDRNAGTGAVVAASYVATGFIVYGAVSGEGGDLVTAGGFWILGQVALIAAGFIYNRITPFNIHAEIERDNVAVGVAFAGVLVAFGNIIRVAASGDFISWRANLGEFVPFVVLGLISLPAVRFVTDKILLPGRSLTDELVNQETPNIGAALVEAFSYVAGSMLIGWVL